MSRLWNCHHCPHLLLSVPLPPENTPSKHPPEQMGQTPVSPSLLACPLSFFRTCLSRGPQARALPFTRGVLEVAAGALQRGHMLKAPCATFWQPKRVKGWAQSYRGKTRVANGQGEGRRKIVMQGITCQQGWEHRACPAACRCSGGLQGHPVQSLRKSRHAGIMQTQVSLGWMRF